MSNFTEWGVGPDGLMRPMRGGGWVEKFAADEICSEMYEALKAAEQSIADFMGTLNYPEESGAGSILTQVRKALARADGKPKEAK